jgi:lipoate-protein ligase B
MMQTKTVTMPCTVYSLGLVDYQEGWKEQRRLVEACRRDGRARLLLEHPPTYLAQNEASPAQGQPQARSVSEGSDGI